MSKCNINYDIWREVGSGDFVNSTPTNEHHRDSVRGMTALIQEALQVLDHPEQISLSQAQIQTLEDTVQQAEDKLVRECELASRVDPAVPRYRRQGH